MSRSREKQEVGDRGGGYRQSGGRARGCGWYAIGGGTRSRVLARLTLDGSFPSVDHRPGSSENASPLRPLSRFCPALLVPTSTRRRHGYPKIPPFPPPSTQMSLLDHPDRDAVYQTPSIRDAPGWRARANYCYRKVAHHVTKHVGVGIICAVAYFDP